MSRASATAAFAVWAVVLALGLLAFLGLPSLAFADNGGDHADGWAETAAAALAAASGGGLAALIGGWLNSSSSREPPESPPPPDVPKTAYPQSNAYEPGGLTSRN
jgi:hypothetical protein